MTTRQIILPSEKFRLEEINLPEELATSLAGQEVSVDVLPEEPPMTRRLNLNNLPDGLPVLIDEEGVAWNAYSPPRVLYTDDWRSCMEIAPALALRWRLACY